MLNVSTVKLKTISKHFVALVVFCLVFVFSIWFFDLMARFFKNLPFSVILVLFFVLIGSVIGFWRFSLTSNDEKPEIIND